MEIIFFIKHYHTIQIKISFYIIIIIFNYIEIKLTHVFFKIYAMNILTLACANKFPMLNVKISIVYHKHAKRSWIMINALKFGVNLCSTSFFYFWWTHSALLL